MTRRQEQIVSALLWESDTLRGEAARVERDWPEAAEELRQAAARVDAAIRLVKKGAKK
jgi:xylose isomerase